MTDYGNGASVTLAAATVSQIFPKRLGRRLGFTIANTGSSAAYVNPSDDQIAVAGSGILLNPGGVLSDADFGPTFQCWQGAVTAISTVGTTLAVWERVK